MKNLITSPRVLYFTGSARVTADDQSAAEWISSNVGYRNGSLNPGDRIEPCDAVAGPKIPPLYLNNVPVVTTKAELDAVMKAKAEGATSAPAGGVRIKNNAKPWGNDGMRRDPLKKLEAIEYMMDDEGEPVVIDGQLLVMGSPEQIAYQANLDAALAPPAGDDTQVGAEGAQAGVASPATAPAAASAPEPPPAPKKAKRGLGRGRPTNAPKKPAAAPGWGRNP